MWIVSNRIFDEGLTLLIGLIPSLPPSVHVSMIFEASDGKFYLVDAAPPPTRGIRCFAYRNKADAVCDAYQTVTGSERQHLSKAWDCKPSSMIEVVRFLSQHKTLIYELTSQNCQTLVRDLLHQYGKRK
eukprot:TRINITY_DN21902_c0_g1_i1.p2 TRINITY_DN21902_c0_g1~~TRINITY_DN21902_c0_g1_i1.p2  ORF type:complete len:129 (+),score=17.83 TRINITY_DN21902_c0_g1_i1:553-939(+)